MPITPEARQRLARKMEDRRSQLRLRWQDVAEAGGISLKTLHSVRAGDSGIAALTVAGIEAGLRWEHGTVAAIIDGNEPLPPPALPGPDQGLLRDLPASIAEAADPHLREINARLSAAYAVHKAAFGPEPPGGWWEHPAARMQGSWVFPDSEREAAHWDRIAATGMRVDPSRGFTIAGTAQALAVVWLAAEGSSDRAGRGGLAGLTAAPVPPRSRLAPGAVGA